jgi:predicted kinase
VTPTPPLATPRLIVLGGLPGTGKTTLARAAAAALGAAPLRIDTIEAAIDASAVGGRPLEDAGYRVAYGLAADLLTLGHTVIADSVNPAPVTRIAWAAVATAAGCPLLQVEIVCSDRAEHRRRIETRRAADPDAGLPDWAAVEARDYRPWPEADAVIDTATLTPDAAATRLIATLR